MSGDDTADESHVPSGHEACEAEADNLREALASRDVISQAKGMLMERHGIDADAAFDLLRSESQHRNVKLRDIATEFTDTGDPDSPD